MHTEPHGAPVSIQGRRKSNLLPLLGLLAIVPCGITGWYFLSGDSAEIREAKKQVAGIEPAVMAKKLFANEPLPDVIPLEILGVLDARLGHCQYEYIAPMGSVRMEVRRFSDLKVYGLLYPPGSRVMSDGFLIREVAEEAKAFQDARDVENEEYCDLWDTLCATYEDLAQGAAVLVELNEESYPELYEQVRNEALVHANTRGSMMHPSQVYDLHISMTARLLKPELLREGLFKVQIVEHNRDLANEVEEDDFTKGLQIVRTVKEVKN